MTQPEIAELADVTIRDVYGYTHNHKGQLVGGFRMVDGKYRRKWMMK